MRTLIGYFLRGLLVVVPVGLTLWILWAVFTGVDQLIPLPEKSAWTLPKRGTGFLVVIGSVTLIGFLTSNIVTRWLFGRVDRLFTRVPVVKLLYTSIKDVIQAFVSEEKKFDRPVLVRLGSEPEIEVIGFVTRGSLEEFGAPDKVAVYVPQSYNFAANLVIVPRDHVRDLDLPAADVMAFVVSGGVSDATRPSSRTN